MKILFDLITPQAFIGGAGEYIRRVFFELMSNSDNNIQLIGAIDSSIGKFAYQDLTPDKLLYRNIRCVDLGKKKLTEIVKEHEVDEVFIGAAQYWGARYNVQYLNCRVICVIHDLQDEECGFNNIHLFNQLRSLNKFSFLKYWFFGYSVNNWNRRMASIIELYKNNKNVNLVTVSEYSRYSLQFNYGISNRIEVLYSPQRLVEEKNEIDNVQLRNLIDSKKKYYLLLGGNRPLKNAQRVLSAFKVYTEECDSSCYLVTIGMKTSYFNNHIVLPYLTAGDLNFAYKKCYALIFPSMFEGFGYPPIEAMQYGKPILVSNVSSIPEICKDAAIYFSPFYVSDIYRAFCKLNDDNYEEFSRKSLARYKEVSERQTNDLHKLINLLTML